MSRDRRAALVAATGAAALLAWAAPGVTWLPGVRRRAWPALAGIGAPGHLALTFDDGPDRLGTTAVLAQLDALGWRATFFMLGAMVEADPGTAREVAAAGHEVALHGYHHVDLLLRSPAATRADLSRGRDAVHAATGVEPVWFRPPGGVLSAGALAALRGSGLRPLLWSAWGRDWRADATPASVVAALCAGVLDGGTALLHDSDVTSAPASWRTTAAALPLLADEAAARGLTVGPVGEHGLR